MIDVLKSGWIGWAIGIGIGVPLLLVVLTEVLGALTRRGSAAAKPVRLLRNWVVPTAGLFALLAFALQSPSDQVWVKIVATLLGFLLILLVLGAFNVALFANAEEGSWRERIPSIFVDIARLALIVVGLAILFSWVWSADVGGLIAALGVTSIVIGLALQNAVGSVISGLLLLFEQPFKLGDWLNTGSVQGQVIEVNWRAVHIDTGAGIQIVPNASLAGASFTNLSLPTGAFHAGLTVSFTTDDPPHIVIETLLDVARSLPMLADGATPHAAYLGSAKYSVDLPVRGPSAVDSASSLYLAWLWYAARRRGLALDGDSTDPIAEPGRLEAAVGHLSSSYGLSEDDVAMITAASRLERFGTGEIVQTPGTIPDAMRFIVDGHLHLWAPVHGGRVDVLTIDADDYVGQSVLTREGSLVGASAATVTTLLVIPLEAIDALVRRHPRLARRIGQSMENRQRATHEALAAAGIARTNLPEG
ncbi:mechanosensitive ion channel [Glaciibacter flavus]|uniref:Mechanosensitive ion channel n=1 Tax=Orlajensenia flava TaxID=2565934 RepID=A0A4S4FUJ5_9MICO|nr:mechanosensitive ion channel family protein [Glaciibacter flavus]THG34529.1 mechanosensitive ion channel [Glaciibacter flavus]